MSPPIVTLAIPKADEAVPETMPALTRAVLEHTGIALTVLPLRTYAALSDAVESGHADLVWAPPLVALDLTAWQVATPLVAVVRAGRVSYPAVLAVRGDSGIQSLDDLSRTRVGWVSKLSAAGHAVPRFFLESLGLAPSCTFREQLFLQSHRAALDAVVARRVEVAATYASYRRFSSQLDMPHASRELRVLAIAGAVPSELVMVGRRVPLAVRRALGAALTSLSPAGLEPLRTLFNVDRFIVADDEHLETLCELRARARVASSAPPPAFSGASRPSPSRSPTQASGRH